MIKEIIMNGIKGQKNSQPLTGKDIIVGPNGSGKTTRMQALGISVLGYVPENSKLPAETYKLASAEEMTVGLKLDDFNFTRTFKQTIKPKKDGSTDVTVSQSIGVSPSKGEKSNKDKEARIVGEIGNFPVMLDFKEFLSLSDAKRRKFIYSLSPIKSDHWDKEVIKKYLKDKLLTIELEVNNPDQYQIMAEMINQSLEQFQDSLDIQAGLQSMLDWAKAKQSHWTAEKKNAQGAVRKIADLKNELEETDRNITENKAELNKLQDQLTTIKEELVRSTEKKRAIDKRNDRLKELNQLINSLKLNKTEEQISQELVQLNKQIENLRAAIKEVNVSDKIASFELELKNNEKAERELVLLRDNLYKEMADIKAQLSTFNNLMSKLENWKGFCVLSDTLPGKNIACDKDFSKVLLYGKAETESLNKKLTDLQQKYNQAVNKLEKVLFPRDEELKEKIKAVQDQANQQFTKNDVIRNEIAELEKSKNNIKNFNEQISSELSMYQKEIERLESEPVEVIAPLDMLEIRKEGLSKQIQELKIKLEKQEKAKTTLSNLKSSMIDSKKAGYYADCSKHLADFIGAKGIQGEIVKEILEPIREDIQNNLKAMGILNEFYFAAESETGKEIFQFGWKDDCGSCRNFDALSTGQQMLLLIAMMITFLDKANPPLKILAIDNMENLDKHNFHKVINGLNKIFDKLDNIILAGVVDVMRLEGWKIWNLAFGGTNDQVA